MALSINYPVPDSFSTWQEWAQALTQVLSQQLGSIPSVVPPGTIVLFSGSTPQGILRCNGGTFSKNAYPVLYNRLGGTTLPTIADTSSGQHYGLVAG